jgi:hypothetical protein
MQLVGYVIGTGAGRIAGAIAPYVGFAVLSVPSSLPPSGSCLVRGSGVGTEETLSGWPELCSSSWQSFSRPNISQAGRRKGRPIPHRRTHHSW